MDLIFNPEKFFYGLVQIFAKAIDMIISVCQQICGIPNKDGKSILVDLISPDANGGAIYITFVVMISITIIFSFLIAMAESFRFKNDTGITPLRPYSNVLKSAVYIILISFCFPLVIMVIGLLGQVIQDSLGNGNGRTIGSTILMNCFDTTRLNGDKILDWQNAWSNGVPSWQVLIEANKDVPQTFNIWQAIISIGVMISPLIGIFMYMGKRLINILLLYVVSPIAFAMLPRDEGYAKDEWFKDMKSALLGGIVIMIIFTLFVNVSPMLYKLNLVEGDSLMNSLFQSALVGAGAMCILSVGKVVLKFLGCDDSLIAMQSASPMRALGAIKRGAGAIYRGAKSLKSGGGKPSTSKSGESLGAGGSMDMSARFKRIEDGRRKNIQNSIALKNSSQTIGVKSGNIGCISHSRTLTANAVKPSYKLSTGGKVGISNTQSNIKSVSKINNLSGKKQMADTPMPLKANKAVKTNLISKPQVNKAGLKTDKVKVIKAKSDKENGADKMTKAFDKFLKKFNSTLKPVTAAAKMNNKGILKAKLELKKPIKTVSSINKIHKPRQSAKGKKAIYINKTGINNVVRNTNIVNTNGANNQKSTDAILRRRFIANERLLKENLNKIKKVSLNVQAVPRQVDKIVRKRK